MSMESSQQNTEQMGTKPVREHAWLQQLVGEWRTETEMFMPDGTTARAGGTESVMDLRGLWAYGEGTGQMPDGSAMKYYVALGWDVSFKEYRGFMLMDVSSHLWKYTGELSEDGRVMTLHCTGPHMERDGETAEYRDVIEIVDADHRRLTSFARDDQGEWHQIMRCDYTRVR